ncbi:unnamed protein product, partial [Linum tenue]
MGPEWASLTLDPSPAATCSHHHAPPAGQAQRVSAGQKQSTQSLTHRATVQDFCCVSLVTENGGNRFARFGILRDCERQVSGLASFALGGG